MIDLAQDDNFLFIIFSSSLDKQISNEIGLNEVRSFFSFARFMDHDDFVTCLRYRRCQRLIFCYSLLERSEIFLIDKFK